MARAKKRRGLGQSGNCSSYVVVKKVPGGLTLLSRHATRVGAYAAKPKGRGVRMMCDTGAGLKHLMQKPGPLAGAKRRKRRK